MNLIKILYQKSVCEAPVVAQLAMPSASERTYVELKFPLLVAQAVVRFELISISGQ